MYEKLTVILHVTYTVTCKPCPCQRSGLRRFLPFTVPPFTPLFIQCPRYSRFFFQSYLGLIILYFLYHIHFWNTLDAILASPVVYINPCRGRLIQTSWPPQTPLVSKLCVRSLSFHTSQYSISLICSLHFALQF